MKHHKPVQQIPHNAEELTALYLTELEFEKPDILRKSVRRDRETNLSSMFDALKKVHLVWNTT